MARGPDIGVLLAGGASSRMGSPKALLRDSAGRTFLERLVATMGRGGCAAVVVVAGRHIAEMAQALPEGALLVHNPGWERGQLSSAQVGLRAALALSPGRIVLHVIDQPLLRAADVERVREALGRLDLAVAAHRGTPGHPIVLSLEAASRVVGSRAQTLRAALARAARRRVTVEGCSKGCVRGANTPAEVRALLGSGRAVSGRARE